VANIPNAGIIDPNMGTIKSPNTPRKAAPATAHTGLADALFSTTQQRVLGLLFGQPGRSFYANELIALTGGGSGAVQRELARLAHSGPMPARPSLANCAPLPARR
jgi:hypothetical protein